uniref:Uncharacterized protein n=1 Tax=viral metagenome TaxID=1070528 RepID=A0A6C0CA91_9ZZZZ
MYKYWIIQCYWQEICIAGSFECTNICLFNVTGKRNALSGVLNMQIFVYSTLLARELHCLEF